MASASERSAKAAGALKAAISTKNRKLVVRGVWLILQDQGYDRSISDVGQSIDNIIINGGYAKEPTISAIEEYLFPETPAEVTPIRKQKLPDRNDLIPTGERSSLAYSLRFAAVAVRGEDLSNYRKRNISIIPRTFGSPAPLRDGCTWGDLEDWMNDDFFPTCKRLGGVGRAYGEQH
jgi:hypothetical protein